MPLYPGAVLYQQSSPGSAVYVSTDSSSTVDAWYRREWPRAGLTYVTDYQEGSLKFRIYTKSGNLYGYATQQVGAGLTGIAMILGSP